MPASRDKGEPMERAEFEICYLTPIPEWKVTLRPLVMCSLSYWR